MDKDEDLARHALAGGWIDLPTASPVQVGTGPRPSIQRRTPRIAPLPRAGGWARRHPMAAVAGMIVFALAAVMTWWRWEEASRASRETDDAALRADSSLAEWRSRRYYPRHDLTSYRERLGATVSDLERILATQPLAHPLRARLGRALRELGRAQEARGPLEEAVRAAPEEGAWHWWLARAYADLGLPAGGDPSWSAKAQSEVRSALASPSWSAESWELALAKEWPGSRGAQTEEAIRQGEGLAFRFTEGGEEILLELGNVAPTKERRLSLVESALRLAPSWSHAHAVAAGAAASLASERRSLGQSPAQIEEAYRTAVAHVEAGLELDRSSPEVQGGRAEVLQGLEKAIQADPSLVPLLDPLLTRVRGDADR